MLVSHRNKTAVILGMIGASTLGSIPSAQAQSSVTLYGIVDGSVLYTSKTLNMSSGQNAGRQFSFTDGSLNGSRFGMRGREDFGGGMAAVFDLESGIDIANGSLGNSNGNQFGRLAWVGLDGGFGTVKAGLQFSPFFLALYDSDPRQMSYFGSGLVTYIDNALVTGLFNSNAVSYTTPEIAGLQASALLALGGVAGDFQAGRQYSGSLKYHLGSLTLDAALYSGNPGGSAATTPVPSAIAFDGRTLGASYRFRDLTVMASFVSYKRARSFDNYLYSGGLSYSVTPELNVDAGVWVTRDENNTNNHSIMGSSGVEYFLSKTTTLYGQVGIVNNHGAMDTGLSVNNALFEAAGTTFGADIGIRHVF
jgi:predicted porin